MEKRTNSQLILSVAIIGSAAILGLGMMISADILSQALILKERIAVSQIKTALPPGPAAPKPQMPMEPGVRKVEGVKPGVQPVKGQASAKVTIVVFSDFQCPVCYKFAGEIQPRIQKDYISSGKVNLAFRSFPMPYHELARRAVQATFCAAQQGKYWEMSEKITSSGFMEPASLKEHAAGLQLDQKKFEACLVDHSTAAKVDADIKEAERLGVRAVPTIFINGRMIEGVPAYEVFQKIIEEELNKK